MKGVPQTVQNRSLFARVKYSWISLQAHDMSKLCRKSAHINLEAAQFAFLFMVPCSLDCTKHRLNDWKWKIHFTITFWLLVHCCTCLGTPSLVLAISPKWALKRRCLALFVLPTHNGSCKCLSSQHYINSHDYLIQFVPRMCQIYPYHLDPSGRFQKCEVVLACSGGKCQVLQFAQCYSFSQCPMIALTVLVHVLNSFWSGQPQRWFCDKKKTLMHHEINRRQRR